MRDKRVYPRFNVQLPANYKLLHSDHPRKITVVDIGAEGMRFLSDDLFDVGQVIEMEIYLNSQERVYFRTEIMWLAKLNEKQYNVGVKIVDALMSDEIKFIQYYCQKMIDLPNTYKKILLVDDEKDMVRLLQIELERENYHVVCAYDGEEGYDKYLSEKPDLIVLDVAMPKMNGYYLCKKIRREKMDTETPIVMLTAKNDDSDRIIGRVVGAHKYMTKPFEMQALLDTVKGLVEKK